MAKSAVCLSNCRQFGQYYFKFILSEGFGKKKGKVYFGNDWRTRTIRINHPELTESEARGRHGELKCPTVKSTKCGWGQNKNVTNSYYDYIENPSSFIGWGNRKGYYGNLGKKALFETHLGRDTVWMFDGHAQSVTWEQVLDLNTSPKLFDE